MLSISRANVNQCLPVAMKYLREEGVSVSPRGQATLEYPIPVCTTYLNPKERVLFEPLRDANPFFHLMEALWILGGRNDVEFPCMFNKGLAKYSDNGTTFHGAYGHRLRSCGRDQLSLAIDKFLHDKDTRQVVLQIWNYHKDLNVSSNDIPCNDLIMCKIRDNKLNITVCNRSNDVIWGAYGANVVQFSIIQEYLAAMIGCKVGVYNQVSDSFHVYTENPQWEKLKDLSLAINDPYTKGLVSPYPLVDDPDSFDEELGWFLSETKNDYEYWENSFFPNVAIPMYNCWFAHKMDNEGHLYLNDIKASDWRLACKQWLSRREDHV